MLSEQTRYGPNGYGKFSVKILLINNKDLFAAFNGQKAEIFNFGFFRFRISDFRLRNFETESIAQPPAPLPARRANRPEGRAYTPEGEHSA